MSFVQPSLLTLTPTSLRMAKRHHPLCIALRNSAHIRSLIYVDPTRRLWWPGQEMPGLIAPFYRRTSHHLRRGRDLCKVSQRVLTETGPGPGPGPSPLLQPSPTPHPPAPGQSSLSRQHGCWDMELSINYYFMLETKKQMLLPHKHQQSLLGWLEGVKGQGEKGGMELPHPCLSPQTSKAKATYRLVSTPTISAPAPPPAWVLQRFGPVH